MTIFYMFYKYILQDITSNFIILNFILLIGYDSIPQKLAITSPTSGGRSVGIVRSRTQTMSLVFSLYDSIL
jgi:hypothetical protein